MDNKQSETLESLARLYLFIAAIDRKFQDVEELTIKEKLIEWDIGADQEDLDSVISSAIESLKSQEQLTQIIEQSIEIIDRNIDEDNKIIVLNDLIEIAISDGDLDDEERDLISALAKEWDLPDYDNVDKYIREVIINLTVNLKSPDDFLKEAGLTEEEIESVTIKDKDQDLSSEMIGEVFEVDGKYLAQVKDTDEDITELINNQAKLKYAYEHSGFVRGKRDANGNFVWRVLNKK